MKNIIIALVVFCCSSVRAITSEVVRVKMQEVTPIELVDTVMESGETVIVRDEANSRGTVTLHVGDGTTAGGAIVSDPFSLKAAYMRPLLRSEYTIQSYGNASYSNGVWELITPVASASYSAANTGGVVIVSAYPIARVEGTEYFVNATVTGDALNETKYTVSTNFSISVKELDSPYIGAVPFRAGISNLIVYAWEGSHLLGITNNAIGSTFLVNTPEHESSAIPLGWWQDQMENRYADDWSQYSADNPVDLAYQDLKMNPYVSCVSTGYTGSISWRRNYLDGTTRDLMTLSTTNSEFHIATYENTTTSVVVRIDASLPFAEAPVLQMATNLINVSWTNIVTTSDWPASTWYTVDGVRKWRVFTLSATFPEMSQAFFRVIGTPTNNVVESLRLDIPLIVNGTDVMTAINSKIGLSDVSDRPTFAQATNITQAVIDTYKYLPYTAFSGEITPANGTATVVYASGNMPKLIITSPTVVTLDPTGFDTNGVSRISLAIYSGTNSVLFSTNVITFTTTPTLSTNCWNTILIKRVSNCIWKGAQL